MGALAFQQACKLGAEGIASKRLGSRYQVWAFTRLAQVKNPEPPAARREAEEDWSR